MMANLRLKYVLVVFALLTLRVGSEARASEAGVNQSCTLRQVEISGAERTDRNWLIRYLGLNLSSDHAVALTESMLRSMETKLQTTGVFSSVKASVLRTGQACDLQIALEEKWTLIPVLRGVYGGGTPLRVLGLYDIHTFGKLLTFGGETRKYGDAPPGFIGYFRDPRAAADRYYFGAEFWREFRRRDLYDRGDGRRIGAVSSAITMSRIRVLVPPDILLGDRPAASVVDEEATGKAKIKVGADFEVLDEAPSIFDSLTSGSGRIRLGATAPEDLGITPLHRRYAKVLPTLLIDTIRTNNLEYDGFRVKVKAGPVLAGATGESDWYGLGELESFYFKILPGSVNLAWRGVVGATNIVSLQNQYYLGGLDTIRGLPDGAVYGTHAAFANLELRYLTGQFRYLGIQSVAFVDVGGAGSQWDGVFGEGKRATAGVGVRFAIPQVYRLAFRIDYGIGLTGPRTQGITAGMNQFFDPYIPL